MKYTAAAFGAMGLAYANETGGNAKDPVLQKAIDYLVAAKEGRCDTGGQRRTAHHAGPVQPDRQCTGVLRSGRPRIPRIPGTKGCRSGDRWISSNEPVTTQDRVFKIFTLNRYGTAAHKRAAWTLVEELADQQQPDGGWKESDSVDGSNAFATGQVLYAFKQAGISTAHRCSSAAWHTCSRTRSSTRHGRGSWKAVHTQSQRKSVFRADDVGGHRSSRCLRKGADGCPADRQAGRQVGGKEPGDRARRVGIDEDDTGRENALETALKVLKEVVATLPEDLNVGIACVWTSLSVEVGRDLPGHRAPRADREARSRTHRRRRVQLAPRGETPLVASVLKTVEDLEGRGRWLRDPDHRRRGKLSRRRKGRGTQDQGVGCKGHAQHRGLHADRKQRERNSARSRVQRAATTTARRTGSSSPGP